MCGGNVEAGMCGTTFHKRATLKIEGKETILKMRVSDNQSHLLSFLTDLDTKSGNPDFSITEHLSGLRFALMNVQGEDWGPTAASESY